MAIEVAHHRVFLGVLIPGLSLVISVMGRSNDLDNTGLLEEPAGKVAGESSVSSLESGGSASLLRPKSTKTHDCPSIVLTFFPQYSSLNAAPLPTNPILTLSLVCKALTKVAFLPAWTGPFPVFPPPTTASTSFSSVDRCLSSPR